MIFNNIIYLIVILTIYHIDLDHLSVFSPLVNLSLIVLSWSLFFYMCHVIFRSSYESSPRLYHRKVLLCSMISILIFSMDTYLFNLRHLIRVLPYVRLSLFFESTVVIFIYLMMLSIIWFHSYDLYQNTFPVDIGKRDYIIQNLRFNIPIVIPYLLFDLLYDLLSWTTLIRYIERDIYQFILFSCFLIILVIFLPAIIPKIWGCKKFISNERLFAIKEFLKNNGFRYREILRWPNFRGQMLTAGIMGIVPRFRYILITDSLMENLTLEETKAVIAHEMGHIRFYHFYLYLLFFILFIVFSKGFFELLYYLFIPYTLSEQNTFLYLGLSIPAVFSLIIYFRYLVGFFMRNLERQADAYSAHIMGDPTHTILSLEKIALLSGRIRDLPSWHHFSIKERVEFLNRFFRDPMLLRRHTRFLILCLFLYLLGFSLLIYGVNSTAIRRAVILDSASKLIRSSRVDPKKDLNLFIDVAMIYHDMGEIKKAVSIYEEILRSYKDAHIALNNLAWIFATTDKEELRDPKRALMLAKRAVSLKRCAEYLDTLAEAYWINGMRNEAIRAEEEALDMAKEGRDYYMAQLKRFKKALPYSSHYSNYNNS